METKLNKELQKKLVDFLGCKDEKLKEMLAQLQME